MESSTPYKLSFQSLISFNSPCLPPDQNTFYYARAIENPTCRWSTYDSIRIDEKPAKNYPKIMREMAWSSPIWIKNK